MNGSSLSTVLSIIGKGLMPWDTKRRLLILTISFTYYKPFLELFMLVGVRLIAGKAWRQK